MQITILQVSVEHVPGKNGGYDKAEVAFKDKDGKVSGKNLVSFNNPEAFKAIKNATMGDVLDVTSEKDAKGYWQWVKVVKAGEVVEHHAEAPATAQPVRAAQTVTKNTYETPEERAIKQVYIVRQSSISAAISYLVGMKVEVKGTQDVINVAKQFESYVLAKTDSFADFKGDEQEVL